jgi:long-chain acyl-CoA synthetase
LEVRGRGEIWCRGSGVFNGYIGKDKEASDLTTDGWLKTGDVGAFRADNGGLVIIDRIKNMFKLSQGEYVAAEKVENCMNDVKGVGQCVLVADSQESYCVAIVIGDMDVYEQWRKGRLGGGGDDESSFEHHLLDSIQIHCRSPQGGGLQGFEIPKKIHLVLNDELTIANGMMTPSFKVKRKEVERKYEGAIRGMYEGSKGGEGVSKL